MKRKFLCAALLSFSLNNLVYASNVDSFEQLNEAIQKNTESQINITSDIQFNSDLIEQAIEDLTIDAGHNSLLGNEHRGFIVDKDYNLTVLNIGSGTNDTSKSASGFKANGTYDGGVITFKSDGKLTVKNSTFYNNKNIYTSGGSGAINITKRRTTEADIEKKAQVFIDNSYFFNNEGNGAGAINADVKRLDVSNSQFSYNNAVYRETVVGNGGAINIKGDEEYTDSVLNITNSLFSYNNADAEGGAIASSDIAKINIVSSQFLNNKSGDNGGALYIQGTPNINITDSEFSLPMLK